MKKSHKPFHKTLGASHLAGRANGFTLVEILVGLIIGLIGVLIIFQVFAVSEGQKRTTTSGSDAQQSGTFSLYTLERSIRSAGQNIMTTNHPDEAPILLGCNTRAFNGVAFTTFPMVPVLITSANNGTSDTITIMSGSASGNSNPVNLTAPAPAGGSDTGVLSVSNVFGFNSGATTGDFFITMESGRVRPLVNCTIARVTAVTPNVAVVAPTVPAGAGTVTRQFGAGPTASAYNAAFTVSYTKDATVLNLGANPTFTQYSVVYAAATNQSTLQANDLLGRTAPAVLAENIVNLQAQYGVDTNNDGTIDSWQPATAAWAAGAITRQQITQIKAIRVGIVARSGLLEKVNPTTNACNATPAAPMPLPAVAGTNPAKPAGPAMSVAALPANWQCYRYKAYETVIPVRNAVMSAVKAL